MKSVRVEKVNSLLREVISEVIRRELKNPKIPSEMISVTQVRVTKDLHHAKVHVSLLCADPEKEIVMKLLNKSAGFISVNASAKTQLRFFPKLTFYLDLSSERGNRIESLLSKLLPKETQDPDASLEPKSAGGSTL